MAAAAGIWLGSCYGTASAAPPDPPQLALLVLLLLQLSPYHDCACCVAAPATAVAAAGPGPAPVGLLVLRLLVLLLLLRSCVGASLYTMEGVASLHTSFVIVMRPLHIFWHQLKLYHFLSGRIQNHPGHLAQDSSLSACIERTGV